IHPREDDQTNNLNQASSHPGTWLERSCALASSSSAVSCETTDNHQGNTGFDSHIRFGAVRPARKRSPKAALRERASDSPAAGRPSPASRFEIEQLERKRNMNYDILIAIG